MNIEFKFYRSTSKALAAATESSNGFELLAAECLTRKDDFEEWSDCRPDMPFGLVGLDITFQNEEVSAEMYNNRFDRLYDFIGFLRGSGFKAEQFVITATTTAECVRHYHIVASLICGEYNVVDTSKMRSTLERAAEQFLLANEVILEDEPILVIGTEVATPTVLIEHSVPENAEEWPGYDRANPLSHELVAPFRAIILSNLKSCIFN